MQEEGAGRPFLLHLQPRQRRLNTGDVFSGMGVPGEWQSHAGCKPFTGISAQSPTALHRARSGRTPWPSTVGASGTARQQDASTAHRAALGGTACISVPGTPRKNISACSHRVQSVIGACHHAHKHCFGAMRQRNEWRGELGGGRRRMVRNGADASTNGRRWSTCSHHRSTHGHHRSTTSDHQSTNRHRWSTPNGHRSTINDHRSTSSRRQSTNARRRPRPKDTQVARPPQSRSACGTVVVGL